MPKVSVIVPNYNHARFLNRRLDSILNQTFTDFEVIILDDASKDNSRDVIRPYLKDPRISFHPNETNSGSPFVQWNRGVELARGEYVWLAESDDYAEKNLLATLVSLLEKNPQVGVAYCQSKRMDDEDKPLGTLADWTADLDPQRWQTGFINDGADECKKYLLWKNTVPNASAVLFRKEVYVRAGGAPVDMRLCGDWLAWVRMLLISGVAFVPQCLNHFRIHTVSVRSTTSMGRHYDEKWKVQRFILQRCAVEAKSRRGLAKQVLNEFLSRVRAALPEQRRQETFRALATFWPFFWMAPATVTKSFLNRHRETV